MKPEVKQPEQVHVYDPTNEKVVIGAALSMAISEDAKALRALVRSVEPDQLLVPSHAAAWRALRVIVDRGMTYDREVFRRLVADEVTDPSHALADEQIADLEERGVPANLEWHSTTLRWDATRTRVLRGPIPELIKEIRSQRASPDVVVAAARAVLKAVEGGGERRFMRRPAEFRREYAAELKQRREVGNFWGFHMGALDEKLTEGAMPKRTALVVGLSGMGKTQLCVEITIRQAKAGRKVLYGAWEMGSMAMLDTMVSNVTGIEHRRIIQGQFTVEEQERMQRAAAWITARVQFMDNPFFSPEVRRMRGNGRRPSNEVPLSVLAGYIAESGCDFVIMDLWERCLVDLSYEGVTLALYEQQAMHEQFNVYGVIVQQLLLKDVEKRADRRPTRESIKGSGAYVEVADQIYGVHREGHNKPDIVDDKVEVICLKQRKGVSPFAAEFEWRPQYASIGGEGREISVNPQDDEDNVMLGGIDSIRSSVPRSGRARVRGQS